MRKESRLKKPNNQKKSEEEESNSSDEDLSSLTVKELKKDVKQLELRDMVR